MNLWRFKVANKIGTHQHYPGRFERPGTRKARLCRGVLPIYSNTGMRLASWRVPSAAMSCHMAGQVNRSSPAMASSRATTLPQIGL